MIHPIDGGELYFQRMMSARKYAVTLLLSSTLVVSGKTASVKVPVRLLIPASFPVALAYGKGFPKLVVLVSNPTSVARQVVVEAFEFGEDKTLLKQYFLSENIRAGDSALITDVMEPCHSGFTERSCSVGAIQVRASSEQVVNQPKPLPPWLQLGATDFDSSIDPFGKRQAEASVVVTNSGDRDAHVYLRLRLYNRSGFQVAVCTNEPRPFFSDNNLLVPAGASTRLGCAVSPFKDVADVPSNVRVELLDWQRRR
jgi:hypothetical protein